MTEFIERGPERRKADQPSRYGGGYGKGYGKSLEAKKFTANELASWKLNQELGKYPIFTEEARQNLANEFVEMPSLRSMNMRVLAATLAFLTLIDNNVTPEKFKSNTIEDIINTLLPTTEIDPEERKRMVIRYKAQILIYIRTIQSFRS